MDPIYGGRKIIATETGSSRTIKVSFSTLSNRPSNAMLSQTVGCWNGDGDLLLVFKKIQR